MHSPEFGDYVGVESCADLKSEVDAPLHSDGNNRRRRPLEAGEKEYPPPIPWLARTENLPSSHMPWVMKKYYTGDGRLIIKEEKVKRHEYFQAHRSNGRLILNLIPLDATVEESCKEHLHPGEEETAVNDQFSGEEISGGGEGISNPTVDEAVSDYYRYNGMGTNPCGGFAVSVAAALRPPVHT